MPERKKRLKQRKKKFQRSNNLTKVLEMMNKLFNSEISQNY